MSTPLSDQVKAVVTAGRLGHLVTLDPDGSPQVSLVWVGVDGEQIVSGHMSAWRKVRNVQRDPRVALSIESEGRDERGLDHYLVVRGTAARRWSSLRSMIRPSAMSCASHRTASGAWGPGPYDRRSAQPRSATAPAARKCSVRSASVVLALSPLVDGTT